MRAALLVVLLLCGPARAETVETLLATLHRAQDALALEGETARSVHDRLLRMLDERIGRPHAEHATGSVVLYALSGGDPRVATRALASVERTARDAILVRGVLAYVTGRNAEARRLLALIRPERLRGRLGSLVAMAQAGTALRADDPDAARSSWQRVRLEAPGTLLEEAALRRLVRLALDRDDRPAFFALLRRYWVRFPRSAFRDRMARIMREGVTRFEEPVVLAHLPRLATALPVDMRSELYAHVARSALIEGRARLATVASRRKGSRLSPHRAELVKNLSRLVGRDAKDVRRRLDAMPLAPLSVGDRGLLLAARAVSAAVTADLTPLPPGTTITGDLTVRHRAALDAVDKLLVAR